MLTHHLHCLQWQRPVHHVGYWRGHRELVRWPWNNGPGVTPAQGLCKSGVTDGCVPGPSHQLWRERSVQHHQGGPQLWAQKLSNVRAAAAAALLCLRLIHAEHYTLYIISYASLTIHHFLFIHSICSLPQGAAHRMTNRLWYSQSLDTMPGVPKVAEGP